MTSRRFQRHGRQLGRLLSVLLLVVGAMGAPSVPWADTVEEYTAKAALVFNFARYTDWPESAVAGSAEFLRICVIGDESLLEAFQAIDGRRVGTRNVRTSALRQRDDPGGCDLIFVNSRDRRRMSLLFSAIGNLPVLTVGEMPDFLDYGGIINLYREGGKIRFEVNLKTARQAKLKISSRLLQLARVVGD